MQQYSRSSQLYDNRIYSRKYEVEVGEIDRPALGVPSSASNYDGMQRQSFTHARPIQRNWPEQRYNNFTDGTNVGTISSNVQPGYVSTFKPSREDDLLKKLEMYQQKYQATGQPRTPQSGLPTRKMFEAVQLPGSNVSSNEYSFVGKRQFAYSHNNSPQKEASYAGKAPEGGVQRAWRNSKDYEASKFEYRRNEPIKIYDQDTRNREGFEECRADLSNLRSSYEGQGKVSYNTNPNEQREQRRQTRQKITYDTGVAQRIEAYQSTKHPTPEIQRFQHGVPENYQEARAPFERAGTVAGPSYESALKKRSITHNVKPNLRSSYDQRQIQEYKGPHLRGAYDYRQGTHQRYTVETRGHYLGQPRRQEESLFTEEEHIRTSENEPREERRQNNNSQSKIPLAPKEVPENRQENKTESSQWNDDQDRSKSVRKNDEREDRLRDIRRKVSASNTEESSFMLERSEKKQSLRERSEQLRQRMNEPSPMKQQKSATNTNRTDRIYQQNKQNIDQQPIRGRNLKDADDESKEWRKQPPVLAMQSDQIDRDHTPSKHVPDKKLEFQEETYRKIETINDLNNKINERIRHILSSFNQDSC